MWCYAYYKNKPRVSCLTEDEWRAQQMIEKRDGLIRHRPILEGPALIFPERGDKKYWLDGVKVYPPQVTINLHINIWE